MSELNEYVLAEAHDRESLSVDELLRLLERHHATDTPGIAQDTLGEYGRALADTDLSLDARSETLRGRDPDFIDGTVYRELSERLTDSASWVGDDALYEIESDRVSLYPAHWHDAISGTTDLTECLVFLEDDAAFQEAPGIGTEAGIPEDVVFDVATVVGGFDPDDASVRLEEQKDRGNLIADATPGSYGGLRPRDAAETSDSGSELPPVIDIRDALDEIEVSAEPNVSNEVDGIRGALVEFSKRDRAGQDSLLSDIERQVMELRESLTGNADRRAEGILNRIQLYRNTSGGESQTLSLSGVTLRDDDGNPVDVADHQDEVATLDGALVNQGDPRDAVVVLALYTTDDTAVKTIESQTVSLDPDERYPFEQMIYVPETAVYQATAVFDATDARTITDGRPEP